MEVEPATKPCFQVEAVLKDVLDTRPESDPERLLAKLSRELSDARAKSAYHAEEHMRILERAGEEKRAAREAIRQANLQTMNLRRLLNTRDFSLVNAGERIAQLLQENAYLSNKVEALENKIEQSETADRLHEQELARLRMEHEALKRLERALDDERARTKQLEDQLKHAKETVRFAEARQNAAILREQEKALQEVAALRAEMDGLFGK
jgi:chromosome segregation ATPase